MEYVNSKNPEDADFIKSYIDGYILSRAAAHPKQFAPAKTKEQVPATPTEENNIEAQLDLEDLRCWAENPDQAGDHENDLPNQYMEPGVAPAASKKSVNPNEARQVPHRPSIALPKNEKHLNRAQRRRLARSKAAA